MTDKKLDCIMLIDDNTDDNFFHERAIKKAHLDCVVTAKTSALDALEYIKHDQKPHPDLVFLDINMPGMNGWDFLEEYAKLDKVLQSRVVIVMLTTSENPDDQLRAKSWSLVNDFIAKPLTKEIMNGIVAKYFRDPVIEAA